MPRQARRNRHRSRHLHGRIHAGRPLDAIPVERVMSPRVISCSRSDDLETAHRLMRTHEIHRLPVVDSRGKPIGILSLSDVINHWHGDLAAEMAVEIAADIRGDSPPPRAHRGRHRCLERRRAFIARSGQSAKEEAPACVETVRRSSLDVRHASRCRFSFRCASRSYSGRVRQWLKGSRELLTQAHAPPPSTC